MKKSILALCVLFVLTGCQVSTLDETREKTISFRVVQKQSMTRAALEDACSVLDYFRVTDGEVTSSLTQKSGEASFGTIADEIPYGVHKLYFIGHKSEVTGFENGVASFDKVTDTFSHTLTLEVDTETEPSHAIELLRNVAKVELVAVDVLPENLATVEFTITGADKNLDVDTGLGETENTQVKTIQVPETNLGKTNCTFAAYTFLLEDESSITVDFTARDKDGNIIVYHTFENVEMQTNFISRITGKVFGDQFGFSITASTEWAGEIDYEF